MQLFYPTIAVQLDVLSSALGVAVAIALSFIAITLVASFLRFQKIVQQTDADLPGGDDLSPVEMVRLQLARFHDACSRRRATFSFALLRFPDRTAQEHVLLAEIIKKASRREDVTCIYDNETLALLAETEAEDAEEILSRITQRVVDEIEFIDPQSFRVGISMYPEHGLSGRELIQAALNGLEQTTAETPIMIPVMESADADTDEELEPEDLEDETSSSYRDRRELAMLDSLTQVLKPSAISVFMQRAIAEWRRNDQSSTLFCIGLNNADDLTRIHGEDAADAALVAVSKILREQLRSTDLIGRHEQYGFLVLVQCSMDQAAIIGRRINTLVQQADIQADNRKIMTTVTMGVAAYPEHGRNLHQLYTAAQKVLDYNRENDIRAYAVYDPAIHDKMTAKPMKSIKAVRS